MTVGAKMKIQLLDEQRRPVELENILVEATFFVERRRRYVFDAGRTNQHGQIEIGFADFERQRRDQAEFDIMDYNTPIANCDPVIQLSIPSRSELEHRHQQVMTAYGTPPPWASNWPANPDRHQQSVQVDTSPAEVTAELVVQFARSGLA